MATTEQLRSLLDESRNGCGSYIRHSLARRLIYTDGVKDMAVLCGAFWLLDIIGTEAVPALIKQHGLDYTTVGLIEVKVGYLDGEDEARALIELTTDDDKPAIWSRHIPWTDFPVGHWVFKLGLQQDTDGALCGVMCLLSED